MKEEKDDLERFVQEHREEFDLEVPPSDLWEGISQGLPQKKKAKMIPLSRVVQMAAVFIALMGMGIALLLILPNEKSTSLVSAPVEQPKQMSLGDFGPELAEVEDFYTSQVNLKMQRLRELKIDPELLEDVAFLEEEFLRLQKEMGQSVDNNKIIEAMIDNYRLKLEILEDILENMEGDEISEKYQSKEDEKDHIIYY